MFSGCCGKARLIGCWRRSVGSKRRYSIKTISYEWPGNSQGLTPTFTDPDVYCEGVKTAVIGGTTSLIRGGKFENGAVTAAYGYLFNSVASCLATGKCTAQERMLASGAAEPVYPAEETVLGIKGVRIVYDAVVGLFATRAAVTATADAAAGEVLAITGRTTGWQAAKVIEANSVSAAEAASLSMRGFVPISEIAGGNLIRNEVVKGWVKIGPGTSTKLYR